MTGSSTYCLIDHPLDEALALLSDYTSRVEILSDGLHSLFYHEEICYSYDLKYSVHAPCGDINPASVNERMRRASIEALSDLSLIADRIGADRLVVHPGHLFESGMRDAAETALDRSLVDLAAVQEERGVRFALENMGSWDPYLFKTPDCAERITSLGLGITLDLGHAHLNGLAGAFLETDGIIHLHLHDNCGVFDSHNAIGNGTIPYPDLMQTFPDDATAVIETQRMDQFIQSLHYLDGLS